MNEMIHQFFSEWVFFEKAEEIAPLAEGQWNDSENRYKIFAVHKIL